MDLTYKYKNMDNSNNQVKFSVIMPTYNNAAFIRRAINSLLYQSYSSWELIIVNDGSNDDTYERIKDLLDDIRFRYIVNEENEGLGAALNKGISHAKYEYIAYLPADDFYYKDHLMSLSSKFKNNTNTVLAFSGMKFDHSDSLSYSAETETKNIRPLYPLQLVQTAHKKTNDKWLTREEYVTDDLFLMFWHKLLDKGSFDSTGQITSYWGSHPQQRHKLISEKYGGCLNMYRSYYKVKSPIRLRMSKYKFTDEVEAYKNFHQKCNVSEKGLKILLVGELAYNPERIYALEKAGHELYGLWIKDPRYTFAYVGPLPFGHVKDIGYDNEWKEKVQSIKPDIIYALGNWDSIDLAHEVMNAGLDIPFVWHFKEGPLFCTSYGAWPKLYELYTHADGRIFISEQNKSWYELFCGVLDCSFILDLDLPIKDLFDKPFSKKLSDTDQAIHTVVTGRLVGVDEKGMEKLAKQNIHLHLYSECAHDVRVGAYEVFQKNAPNHFHVHKHVSNDKWIEEFSKYDAGWLHSFDSKNNGDLLHATWDDLNMPARLYTLAAAGLPMIQKDNSGHIVSMQEIARKYDIGIFYKDIENLGEVLYNKDVMKKLQQNMINSREEFTFDYYVNDLIKFFHGLIDKKQKR